MVRKKRAAMRYKVIAITDNEIELLGFIAQGKTNQQIADETSRSVQTIKNEVGTLLRKLQVPNRAALCVSAIKNKWIDVDEC